MTAITDRLDGATNVLLRTPPMDDAREVCNSLLTEGIRAQNVLFVSYTQQPDGCIEQLGDTVEGMKRVAVVTVGDASGTATREGVTTENVSTASDLTGLGIQVGEFLSGYDGPAVVCFDSLTSMLQYVDFETAYEFLHAVTGQIHAAGARAHFHIDPSAHDKRDVAGITSLFDASVSLDDGTSVRTRDIIE